MTDRQVRAIQDIDPVSMVPGSGDVLVSFATRSEMQTVLARLLTGARQEVLYENVRLDVEHLGSPDALAGMENLLMANRAATLRTLTDSSQALVQSGHRLVETLRRFMPQVECRIRRPGTREGPSGFVVVDRVAYLLLPDPDRYAGTAGFNAPGTAEKLRDLFNQSWDLAQPDPEMLPLTI